MGQRVCRYYFLAIATLRPPTPLQASWRRSLDPFCVAGCPDSHRLWTFQSRHHCATTLHRHTTSSAPLRQQESLVLQLINRRRA